MPSFKYDRSSKWLIQHHGDMILRLGGMQDVISWRPLQAEVVQPRQLPDGLLEVQRAGQAQPDLFVLELATYPDRRVTEQVLDDLTLVYLDRRVLAEVLVVVLHPKGNLRVTDGLELRSQAGWTRWQVNWRVVELWTLSAEELLATQEPGLMPWVPLAHWDGPPEPVFHQCQAVIDQKARPEERGNLLAVAQVLAGLRYNDPGLLSILGGKHAMIESPVLQELLAERAHRLILGILDDRFGSVSMEVSAALTAITDDDQLQKLAKVAARCPNLEAFRQQLITKTSP